MRDFTFYKWNDNITYSDIREAGKGEDFSTYSKVKVKLLTEVL